MTFEELLLAQGISKEQATKVIDAMPSNKFYLATEENLDIRYKKAKEDLTQTKGDLDTANKLIEELNKTKADAESYEKKVSEYQAQVAKIEAERVEERKTYAIKEALTKAGATDPDYMIFKLGGQLEVEKDGTIKNLENKVKELKEANPSFFPTAPDPQNPPAGGRYKPIDSKLPGGTPPAPTEPKSLAEAIKQQYTEKEGS